MGYVTITHPFHPLYGKELKILSTRKYAGEDIFSLRNEERGTIAIPRNWTDKADLLPESDLLESPPILSIRYLVILSELLHALDKSE